MTISGGHFLGASGHFSLDPSLLGGCQTELTLSFRKEKTQGMEGLLGIFDQED